jgi:hypothetical protein
MKVTTKFKFAVILMFLSGNLWTQSITYDYDGTGNRIDSRVVHLKSAHIPIDTTSLQSNDPLQKQPIKEVHEDQLGTKSIKIYPNPTAGTLNIEVQGFSDQTVTIFTLYDLSGKILVIREIQGDRVTLDLSPYAKGIYILKIQSAAETRDWKIIKE